MIAHDSLKVAASGRSKPAALGRRAEFSHTLLLTICEFAGFSHEGSEHLPPADVSHGEARFIQIASPSKHFVGGNAGSHPT